MKLSLSLTVILSVSTPMLSAATSPAFDGQDLINKAATALAADAQGFWRTVHWHTSATQALASASTSLRPLFVHVYITTPAYLPWESGEQVCLGARCARGTVLSDARVIASLNATFSCYAFNAKTQGFPKEIPGLALCAETYRNFADPNVGFSVFGIFTPDGRHLIATSGFGSFANYQTSRCFVPNGFLEFMKEGNDRFLRWQASSLSDRVKIEREGLAASIAACQPGKR